MWQHISEINLGSDWSTCVYNKCSFPLQAIFAMITQQKKPHDPDSVLQVTRGWILQTWLQEGWSCTSKAGFSCQLCLWFLTALERETALFLQYRRTSLGCHYGTGTLWRNCATVVLQINKKVTLLGRPSKWQMHWCIIREQFWAKKGQKWSVLKSPAGKTYWRAAPVVEKAACSCSPTKLDTHVMREYFLLNCRLYL